MTILGSAVHPVDGPKANRSRVDQIMAKKNLSVIGKPLRKIDAMAKCAGETVYADDLNLPRMIYAKLLRSPHPHARILGINTARALKLDGVIARAALMPRIRAW